MEALLQEYGLFLAKTITVVIGIVLIAFGISVAVRKGRMAEKAKLDVEKLNAHYDDMIDTLRSEMMSPLERKLARKTRKKQRKAARKKRPVTEEQRRRIFVVDFKGDLFASSIASLREEITAIISVAEPQDEVVLRLESSGGVVHAYGLAAAQLMRIRQKQIPLVVCIDKVAASGGYLMACVANRILAAPFAIVGSIGVAAEFPNFHRLLQKLDVDVEQITAGKYKRTLTMYGENTEPAREKFREQIEDIHAMFKEFVRDWRSSLDIEKVATGEYWYGKRAVALNLVDDLQSSDEYLLQLSRQADIFHVQYKQRESIRERLIGGFEQSLRQLLGTVWPGRPA